jgi:hypothetical protein
MVFEYVRSRHILHRRLGLPFLIGYLFSPRQSNLREASAHAVAARDKGEFGKAACVTCHNGPQSWVPDTPAFEADKSEFDEAASST